MIENLCLSYGGGAVDFIIVKANISYANMFKNMFCMFFIFFFIYFINYNSIVNQVLRGAISVRRAYWYNGKADGQVIFSGHLALTNLFIIFNHKYKLI